MNISIDNIRTQSYSPDYCHLLSQLTECPPLTPLDFELIIKNLPKNHFIFVCLLDSKPIGMITLLIEQKLIHNGKCVGHIEDVVVDKQYNGKGIGKQMIQYVSDLAKNKNCYKIILNCNDEIKVFYEKNGFVEKNINMSKYF